MSKNIRRAAVFGSYARGEATNESDVDLLIEADGLTMFDILRIEEELSQLTNKAFDVVEFKALKTSIRERVLTSKIDLI